jgi:hypothetical protein
LVAAFSPRCGGSVSATVTLPQQNGSFPGLVLIILQTDTNLVGEIFLATPPRRLEDAYLAQTNYLFFLDGMLSI